MDISVHVLFCPFQKILQPFQFYRKETDTLYVCCVLNSQSEIVVETVLALKLAETLQVAPTET